MISTLFNNHTIIYRVFIYFGLNNYKVVCCRFIVCGKGLSLLLKMNELYILYMIMYKWGFQENLITVHKYDIYDKYESKIKIAILNDFNLMISYTSYKNIVSDFIIIKKEDCSKKHMCHLPL